MYTSCILVAVEPRAYRDVLAAGLRAARPLLKVIAANPTDLEHVVASQQPDLVLASEADGTTRPPRYALLSVSRREPTAAILTLAPRRLGVDTLTFDRLVALVDYALKPSRDASTPIPSGLETFLSPLD